MPLCDTVLRLAAREMFQPYWSDEILSEAERNLVADGRATQEKAERRTGLIRQHFPEAIVDLGYQRLIESMTNDTGDRHVLAAAVYARADQIVTANVRHFPAVAVDQYHIEVRAPDDFLLNVLDLYPRDIITVLREQAAALKRPPTPIEDVLRSLARDAPRFAQSVDMILGTSS